MRTTVEQELKLQADDGFSLPELGGEPLPSRLFVSTYHDTPGHRLARAGVTLRHRVENGRGLWQLKVPHGAARLELEVGGGPVTVPAELVRLLPALVRRDALAPVARLRTRRNGVRVEGAGGVAEVTIDTVAVLDGTRVLRSFEEIEAELVSGDPKLLDRLGRSLRRAGAREEDTRPKLLKVLELQPYSRPEADTSSAAQVLGATIAQQVERIVAHDPGTRLGADIEDLHQFRVATRRLRAFLRAGRALLAEDWSEELRGELGWLGRSLGPARDLDVLLDHLREDEAGFGEAEHAAAERLLQRLEAERGDARRAMVEALESEQYLDLLDRLEAAAAAPRFVDSDVTLFDIWAGEHRKLRRDVQRLPEEPPDDDLHALRIRAKRARYAAELGEPALGKAARAYVSAAKSLQDVLGEHQDAAVAEERLRALLADTTDPAGHFAAGRLVERQALRRREARAAWPAAWEALRDAGKRLQKAAA
jgi:CHAD domain-containing protein